MNNYNYVFGILMTEINTKINNTMKKKTKPVKRYGRIRDLKPGTRFYGNRSGFIFVLLENPCGIRLSHPAHPESNTPCYLPELNQLRIVPDFEIVELV